MTEGDSKASEIVIARYSEDLDWVENIPSAFKVIIYNKGKEVISRPALARADEIIDLPNSGRESDTILRHILGKNSFTTGYTVFVQGNPFEHSPDIIELLNAQTEWRDLQPLSWQWLEKATVPPPNLLKWEIQEFVGNCRVRPELFSLSTWGPIKFSDPGIMGVSRAYRVNHHLPVGINIASHFLGLCEWPELATDAEQHAVGRFSYGAQFAVKQQRIANLPRRCFELAQQASNAHPMYGYILERLWLHMFGEPFLLPTLLRTPQPQALTISSTRFVPPEQLGKLYLHRAVALAIKRRITSWAQK